ncbi:MAG: hypothetical protein VX723_04475 [Candidatus Thermoplasmatota archaeon]|nr:hypothetical protein [Candidatus Thermoplasmatota archaeon]
MDDGGEAPRLNEKQLAVVEKSLFELLRKQKSQAVPVDLPVPSFWSSVGQLLHHLETDIAETIRDKGMGAEAQMKSRRLGNIRTCISDLTRLRLNAFTQNAVLSNLMKSPQGDAMSAAAGFQCLDWQRHDSAERAFHAGIGHLVEKYKLEVSWNALPHGSSIESTSVPTSAGHSPLTEFSEIQEDLPAPTPAPQQPASASDWDDPDMDEEDRIRQIDAFPDRATGAASPPAPPAPAEDDGLIRILILKDLDDPIISADGSEMVLTAGDVESCSSLIAETLIAAGLAEPAPL